MNISSRLYKRYRFSPEAIYDKSQYYNNRAELSHQPTQAQRFLSIHAVVSNLFNLGRHKVSA